jgi:hypothetical protein
MGVNSFSEIWILLVKTNHPYIEASTLMATYDIFTPPDVAAKMVSYFPTSVRRLLEPSVGSGNLLRAMDGRYDRADVYDINAGYLAEVSGPTVTKYHTNFLAADVDPVYDAIILNPPYQRYQEMDASCRELVRGVSDVLSCGNIDLYIAFLVKCATLLTSGGTMVAIVPSTWMYNKSCTKFRDFLREHTLLHAIHDYGSEKVFPGVDVYCCIVVLTNTEKDSYTLNDEVVPYTANDPAEDTVTLGSTCDIQNGLATLCDDVFIHKKPLFDEPCWRPILKVSKNTMLSALFPYTSQGVLITEAEFKRDNPQTYAYLESNRERLANRDRGHKTYEAWYAYGRRQGLTLPSEATSVYISTLCQTTFPSVTAPTCLFYSGLRITPKKVSAEAVVAALAASSGMLNRLCSKRAGGWVNLTATSLRQVPVT